MDSTVLFRAADDHGSFALECMWPREDSGRWRMVTLPEAYKGWDISRNESECEHEGRFMLAWLIVSFGNVHQGDQLKRITKRA